jgi:RNA polymerase sigma-70 factor, ECF subfamily
VLGRRSHPERSATGCHCPATKRGETRLFRDNDYVDARVRDAVGPPPHADESFPAQERELIASVLRGDRKAAATFVAAHIDGVYAYARHRLSPRAELVDDVVQDVFLAALNGLARFQGQSSPRTWLIGIARHKIDDVYRQRLRASEAFEDRDPDEDEPPSNAPPLDEQIDQAHARAKARHVLARLPERYALMLLWRYWEQRSTREIATAIGTTEKSVERTLARARASFKELWLKE